MEGPSVLLSQRVRVYPIPARMVVAGSNVLALRVRIVGNQGGIERAPQIVGAQAASQLLRAQSRSQYPEFVLSAVFLFVAAYFYYLWWNFRAARENLFFALFNTIFASYLISRTVPGFLTDSSLFLMRMEYSLFLVTPIFFFRFLYAFLGKPFPRPLFIYDALLLGSVLYIVFVPEPDNWRQIIVVFRYSAIFALGWAIALIVRQALQGNAEARYIAVAMVVFAGTVVNDLLLAMGIHRGSFIVSYGFTFFLLCIALILANRYVRLFRQQEKQSTVLRDLDRRKAEFLSNVSHELRTPLAEIMLYAESLADGTLEMEEDIRDAANEIEKCSARLQHIISDTVLLNLLETNQYIPQIEDCKLAPKVEDALRGLSEISSRRKILIDSRIPEDLRVKSDPALLERVLEHVLENAILYNRDGGRLTLETRDGADTVEILVADEGAGIPTDVRGRLFQKFVRGDTSSTYSVPGTGTGLALASLATSKMLGSLSLKDTGSNGSIFSISLVRAAAHG
ncbi:MAG: sensor histidine kinase [Leptospirales bacterium]|nr:sensor histidine kinase [Leptospirales bacterium]